MPCSWRGFGSGNIDLSHVERWRRGDTVILVFELQAIKVIAELTVFAFSEFSSKNENLVAYESHSASDFGLEIAANIDDLLPCSSFEIAEPVIVQHCFAWGSSTVDQEMAGCER